MAKTYKILGNIAGLGTITSYSTLYNTPSSTSAVISTITICNQTTSSVTYRIGIASSETSPSTSEFLAAFISEDFPRIEEPLSDNILTLAFKLIDEKEGERITNETKAFLMHYAACIVKASKEDYLSFIGLSDSISDEEESFLTNFKLLLQLD